MSKAQLCDSHFNFSGCLKPRCGDSSSLYCPFLTIQIEIAVGIGGRLLYCNLLSCGNEAPDFYRRIFQRCSCLIGDTDPYIRIRRENEIGAQWFHGRAVLGTIRSRPTANVRSGHNDLALGRSNK